MDMAWDFTVMWKKAYGYFRLFKLFQVISFRIEIFVTRPTATFKIDGSSVTFLLTQFMADWTQLYFPEETILNIFGVVRLYPLAFQAEGLLSLPASVRLSVRPSVRPSVRKLYLVRTITLHRFELASPNLLQIWVLGYSRLVLKMEVIDLDLQGHFGHFDLEF